MGRGAQTSKGKQGGIVILGLCMYGISHEVVPCRNSPWSLQVKGGEGRGRE